MLKKLLLIFILCLLHNTGYSQVNKQAYVKAIDSLTALLPAAKEDTIKATMLITLSVWNSQIDEKIKAEQYANDALALSKKLNFYAGRIRSYVYLAGIYQFTDELKARGYLLTALDEGKKAGRWRTEAIISRNLGQNYENSNFNVAEKYYLRSAELYLQHKQYNDYCISALHLGYMYVTNNKMTEAADISNKVIVIARKNKFTQHEGQAKHFLADIYKALGNNDKAIENTLELLKQSEAGQLPNLNRCGLYEQLAELYKEKKDFKKAKEYTEKLKNCSPDESSDIHSIAATMAYIKEGNSAQAIIEIDKGAIKALAEKDNYTLTTLAEQCFEIKDYERALKYHQQALDIVKERKVAASIAESQFNVGATCVTLAKQKGNDAALLKKGIALLEASEAFYKEAQNYPMLYSVYTYISEGYELSNQQSKALSAYKNLITYKDSLINYEKREALITKQAEFEYGEKEAVLKAGQKAALEQEQTQRNYAYAGVGVFVLISIGAGVAYSRKRKDNRIIAAEKKRSDDLLLNILPAEVAEELKMKGEAGAKHYDHVSILFTDFVGFTKLSEKFSPEELLGELNYCFKAFDEIITKHNIEKIKTIGDSYMAVSGLPGGNKDHAINAVNAAIEMRNFIENYKAERSAQGRVYFEMRTGINSGEVVAGIVGIKKFAYDVWGDAVNIASRMESNGVGGKINISQSTYELIKDDFETEYRGEIDAKGKGHIKMYFVEPKTNGWI